MLEYPLHDGLIGSIARDCDTLNRFDFESVRFEARGTDEDCSKQVHPALWMSLRGTVLLESEF